MKSGNYLFCITILIFTEKLLKCILVWTKHFLTSTQQDLNRSTTVHLYIIVFYSSLVIFIFVSTCYRMFYYVCKASCLNLKIVLFITFYNYDYIFWLIVQNTKVEKLSLPVSKVMSSGKRSEDSFHHSFNELTKLKKTSKCLNSQSWNVISRYR